VFSEQFRRLKVLDDSNLDFIILDSPLLLSMFYGQKYNTTSKYLDDLIYYEYSKYNNINIFLNRVAEFDPFGRVQTKEESDQDSKDLKNFLMSKHIQFTEYESNDSLAGHIAYSLITNKI